MEWISVLFLSGVLGVRHGFEPDHMAAITDMVGSHTRARRGLKLGLMYALGHGLVVLAIGLLAILAGQTLPETLIKATEYLVGASLIVLGSLILRSLFVERGNYQYTSRWQMIFNFFQRFRKKSPGPASGGSAAVGATSASEQELRRFQMGFAGALTIGIVHGLGAETPTQLVVIGHSSQMGNLFLSLGVLLTFVIGMLMSTSFASLVATWGFLKARSLRLANIAMGLAAGGYSLYLGTHILLSA